MKLKTCFILWHDRLPIYSCDFHSSGKLATGGGDSLVKVWKLDPESSSFQFLSTLKGHNNPVNCVRFSPDGTKLASSGDDGVIILWVLGDAGSTVVGDEVLQFNKENWVQWKSFRGPQSGVTDLSWSVDSDMIISGSPDSSSALWKVSGAKQKKVKEFNDHELFVQGVSWDPLNQFIVTASADRSCRIYKKNNNRMNKLTFTKSSHILKKTEITENNVTTNLQLFADEAVMTFFRRPCWSPDGNLLYLPCGVSPGLSPEVEHYCTYVYTRNDLKKPALLLPSPKPTIAVRWNPKLFKLRASPSIFPLEYRMIVAIASVDAVTIYDTQYLHPIAYVKDLHLNPLTDLTWSSDGLFLVVSSIDGYCSVISFSGVELGEMVPDEERDGLLEKLRTQVKTKTKSQAKPRAKQTTNAADDTVTVTAMVTDAPLKSQ
eukprot:TRINITY_DN1001_c0_g1_i1.p1 TRINITY_DN1001_c0_g1~~TRINITY_DN1001_c0_g1_i1.p1  ORF type:complete len:431 (+),score=105.72 TRINITY_DN1001_c0_g1_i1:44-1336(+)